MSNGSSDLESISKSETTSESDNESIRGNCNNEPGYLQKEKKRMEVFLKKKVPKKMLDVIYKYFFCMKRTSTEKHNLVAGDLSQHLAFSYSSRRV